MKILLSNDDGYRAEGLAALGEAIRPLGTVTIVAPDRNRSGASNSLTLDVPVHAVRYDADAYFVNGTPTVRGPQVQLGADEHYAPVCWNHYDEATRTLVQDTSGAVLRPS